MAARKGPTPAREGKSTLTPPPKKNTPSLTTPLTAPNNQDGSTWWGAFDFSSEPFDWGDDDRVRPKHHPSELIVYEMPVRCFTADASSGVPRSRRGGWLGVADRADHLESLGVNAVELLPVFEYDELEFRRWRNPREHMTNVWGYSHVSFFAPMSRFGSAGAQRAGDPAASAREFKQMVKELHARGIQVILDVVYNHTAELDDANPYTISFR
jgi:isoamylase